jgi:hypothetical protein
MPLSSSCVCVCVCGITKHVVAQLPTQAHLLVFVTVSRMYVYIYMFDIFASRSNACYHSSHNILSSRLLSKNLKTKIYVTLILPVVFYGYKLGLSH